MVSSTDNAKVLSIIPQIKFV